MLIMIFPISCAIIGFARKKLVDLQISHKRERLRLHAAIRNGSLAEVKSLIDEGASFVEYDSRGQTVIKVAAARGSTDIPRFLAPKTTSLEIPCNDFTKDTPLFLDAKNEWYYLLNTAIAPISPIKCSFKIRFSFQGNYV